MQSALLRLPGLDGSDLFSTISGWPSPNFSVLLNWPAAGCHVAWEGGAVAGPLSPVLHSPRVQSTRSLAVWGVLMSSYLWVNSWAQAQKSGSELHCHFCKSPLCSLASGKPF